MLTARSAKPSRPAVRLVPEPLLELGVILGATVLVGLTWFDAFLLPGHGFVRRWYRDVDGAETVALALAIGTAGVAFTSFVLAALLHVWLTPVIVLGVANAVNLAHLPVWIRDLRRMRTTRVAPRALLRALGATAVFVAMPALIFALRYEREEFALTCVNFAPAYATGLRLGDGSLAHWDRNDVLTLDTENQEGNAALIGAFPALFRFLGYRLFYANTSLLSFLLAFVIGRRLGGRGVYGWLFALLLLFNPLVAGIHDTEENLLCMAMLLGALAFLLRPAPSWIAGAAFFGLAFGCRHILLPGLAGVIVFALAGRDRWRAVARVAIGFAIPSWYFALHHALTLGSLLAHESLRHFPEPVPHRFLGYTFELHAILAWPFTDRLYRSPFNPLPTLIEFATAIPGVFGTVLTGFGIAGALRLGYRAPRTLALLLGIALPPLAILMVQGNWSEIDKNRLTITPLAPLVLLMVEGCAWLARGPRRPLVATLIGTLAWAQIPIWHAALGLRVPVDPREYVGRPHHAVETEADFQHMRRVLVREPGFGPGADPGEILRQLPRKASSLRDLWEELADPRYEARTPTPGVRLPPLLVPELFARTRVAHIDWRPAEVPPSGGDRVTLEIPLDRLPAAAGEHWVRAVDPAEVPAGALVLPMATSVEDEIHRGLAASGFPDPIDVFAVRMAMHGDDRLLIGLLRRGGTQPSASVPGDRIFLTMRRAAHAGVLYFANVEPVIQEAWDLDIDQDGSVHANPTRE